MIDFSTIQARDYALLGVALVAVYVVFSMVRPMLLALSRRKFGASAPVNRSNGYGPVADAPGAVDRDLQWTAAGGASPLRVTAEECPLPPDFARELAYSSLELEVRNLRSEAEKLRAEMQCLAEEVRHLKASRNVSPAYGEAMTLAQQGEPPAGIAAQCGISVGEAELVAALARGEPGLDLQKKPR